MMWSLNWVLVQVILKAIYAELHFTYSSVFCIAIYLYTIQNKTYKNLQYLYELIPFIVPPHTVFLMIKEF